MMLNKNFKQALGIVVVVVVLDYLTTNQRHVGYLSSYQVGLVVEVVLILVLYV